MAVDRGKAATPLTSCRPGCLLGRAGAGRKPCRSQPKFGLHLADTRRFGLQDRM